MKSILKAGAVALAASLFALPAMAANAQHAPVHHAKPAHHKMAAHHKAHVASAHRHIAQRHVAQRHAAGKIERINAKHNTLTINHRVYRLAPRFASASFKQGQKVQIVYKKDRGHRLVEKISAVSA